MAGVADTGAVVRRAVVAARRVRPPRRDLGASRAYECVARCARTAAPGPDRMPDAPRVRRHRVPQLQVAQLQRVRAQAVVASSMAQASVVIWVGASAQSGKDTRQPAAVVPSARVVPGG